MKKIDLFGQELTPFKGNIKQMQFKPYRKINSFSGLKVNSVEDEVGLMSIKDPSFKLINSIKSIVWAIHLSDEEIKNILNNFTAPDLAQAWLGPEEFLDKLKSQLPDKKLKLLTSYLQNTKASRESRAYKEIYKLTCQAFANSAREEINEGEANESAA